MVKNPSSSLPKLPGVYLFKNAQGEIIYIGKAKSLKDRVSSYFQDRGKDWKIAALIEEYAELSHIVTHSETEAMILEAELIQEHQPKYNVLFKDGQPFLYILFTPGEMPSVKIVRSKKQKGTYFGPFLQKIQARRVYNYLMRTFRLTPCKLKIPNGCLKYHLGLCPGNCREDFNPADFQFRIELAKDVLRKDHKKFLKNLDAKIREYSADHAYEKAKQLRDYRENFETIFATIDTHFSQAKFADQIFSITTPAPLGTKPDESLASAVQELLHLQKPAHAIDCFDISHFQSSAIVGSCVRFLDGVPDKNKFRRFAVRSITQQDDYAALREIVERRYKDGNDWPDLILIDGGKGQLNAVKLVIKNTESACLAKKEEIIYSDRLPNGVHLDVKKPAGKLLIAIRDYAHHFAISYHRLKRRKATRSPA